MFRLIGKTPCNGYAFGSHERSTQFVSPGVRYLAADNEVGAFKIFERNRNLRLMQPAGVPGHENALQFGNGQTCNVGIRQFSQADEAIWTYREGLVELGCEAEVDVNGVTLAKPIQRTAVPHLVMVWT